ncbi:MAG: hypothetical protein QGI33_00795 [Candidatus Brocadiia bacterium]|nr:hypothetical protein [Candidatus Brocadiia bacterium]
MGRALWGLGWLTGMVLGVWAIVRITGNPLKRKGRGLAVAGICVSVASLLTFLAIELSIDVGVDSKGRVPSVACRSHLRNVGLGVLMYADDNQDVLPESLTDLVDQGYVTPEPLICPSDTSPMWIGYQCSFDYLGELSISEVEMVADIGRLIVAYESKANPSMAETPCASTATSSNWRNPPSESG